MVPEVTFLGSPDMLGRRKSASDSPFCVCISMELGSGQSRDLTHPPTPEQPKLQTLPDHSAHPWSPAAALRAVFLPNHCPLRT